MNRIILFTAVSSEGQADKDSVSLPLQKATLERLAQSRGGVIIDHIEVAVSRNFFNWYDFRDAALAEGYDGAQRMERHWQARDFDEVLVFDGTRFGRKESIFSEFVLRTIDAGAIIVQHLGGEINQSNYATAMILGAHASAQEMRSRIARHRMGRDGRFAKGLHGGGPLPVSHVEIYDAQHKPTGQYALSPLFLSIWPDVATLLLEGVGWHHVERELYARYKHINPLTGKKFARFTFYHLLTRNPMFWGHLGRRYSYTGASQTENGPMHWVYDELWPAPDYVQCVRNACVSVYEGELKEAIISELRRRRDLRGKASPDRTMRFTSLCVCGTCGHTMVLRRVHKRKDGTYLIYITCNYRFWNCVNHKNTRLEHVEAFVNTLLEDVLTGDVWRLRSPSQTRSVERRQQLEQEIIQLESQMESLVGELSMTPDVARVFIRKRIDTLSARLVEAQREIAQIDTQARRAEESIKAFEKTAQELKAMTLEAFWRLSDREINQYLKRLLGSQQIVIQEGVITGFA